MHRVAVLALDGVLAFDMGIPFQVFGDSRDAGGRALYRVDLVGEHDTVRTYDGFGLQPARRLRALATAETIVLPGTVPPGSGITPAVATALQRAHARGTRIVSICTGAFLLAELGLLDGRRATTHWAFAPDFLRRYPSVALDPGVLYIDEGSILTSAGAAAGIDLCLHVVASDHGAAAANLTARRSVAAAHRSGGQAQFVSLPVPADGQSLQATREWALERLDRALTLDELAAHAAVSRRTLIRRFQQETGLTPLRWLNAHRIARARQLLEETDLPVDSVAAESGFASAAAMRLHFRRELKTHPQAYRSLFRAGEPPALAAA